MTAVLDVGQLETLLAKTFNLGLDVGRGKESRDLVRLRLSKALLGVAEAQALAAESIAIERGVATEKIAEAEGLALHAGAFNGIPDPVFHLDARAMGIVTGLAMVEPDPRAPDRDAALDAALHAATGLAKLLGFRHDCVTAATPAAEAEAMAKLAEAAAQMASAAEPVQVLLDLGSTATRTSSTSTKPPSSPSCEPASARCRPPRSAAALGVGRTPMGGNGVLTGVSILWLWR